MMPRVDWVDAQLRGNREEDGRQNQDDAGGLHEVACNQQDHVDHHQEHPGLHAHAHDLLGNGLQDAPVVSTCANSKALATMNISITVVRPASRNTCGRSFDLQVTVDEHRHAQGVHRGHRRCLGGREHPAIDAAHDDAQQRQAPHRFTQRAQHFAQTGLRGGVVLSLLARHQTANMA